MHQCKHCGSMKTIKYGIRNDTQRHFCNTCNREFVGDPICSMSNALIIGDTHVPYEKKGYLDFCSRIADKYRVGTVYHIGDLVDNHTISYHDKLPESPGVDDELNIAKTRLKDWVRRFPEMNICIGNHDALPFRKIATAGLSASVCKSYNEIFNLPDTWKFDSQFEHNGVLITHGTGANGLYPFANMSRGMMRSIVIGHCHSVAGIQYTASADKLIFGMSVGCGVDNNSFAFKYGASMMRKPIISCGVLVDGKPILEMMDM